MLNEKESKVLYLWITPPLGGVGILCYYIYMITNLRPRKVISTGTALAITLPASVCRELSIRRGDYFDLVIGDRDTIIAQRIKIVRSEEFGEGRDPSLPVIKQNG